jgi:hypothetical protein
MKMSNLALKLKALKLQLHEDLIVHLVLITLPVHFGQFKVSYNTQIDGQIVPRWAYISLCAGGREAEEREDRKCSLGYTSFQNKLIEGPFVLLSVVTLFDLLKVWRERDQNDHQFRSETRHLNDGLLYPIIVITYWNELGHSSTCLNFIILSKELLHSFEKLLGAFAFSN